MSDGITPGVWTHHLYHGRGETGYIAAGEHQEHVAASIRNPADARLMAASKKMLAVLLRFKEQSDASLHTKGRGGIYPALVDAIDSATGRHDGAFFDEPTDAQSLAFAILAGDEAAQWAAADEVRERIAEPEGFVGRAELLRRVAELEEEVREMSYDMHRMNDPHEGLLPDDDERDHVTGEEIEDDYADEDDGPAPRRLVRVLLIGRPHTFAVPVEVGDGVGDIFINQELAIDSRGRLTPHGPPVCVAFETSLAPAPLPPADDPR